MATSESDDFESADEELSHDTKRSIRSQQWSSPTAIDSESDDDTEYVPRPPCVNSNYGEKSLKYPTTRAAATAGERTPARDIKNEKSDKDTDIENVYRNELIKRPGNGAEVTVASAIENTATPKPEEGPLQSESTPQNLNLKEGENEEVKKLDESSKILEKKETIEETHDPTVKSESKVKERPRTQRKTEGTSQGRKKLGTKIAQKDNTETSVDATNTDIKDEAIAEDMKTLSIKDSTNEQHPKPENEDGEKKMSDLLDDTDNTGVSIMTELAEPEELKSNKTFKDIFTPQGWEGLGTDIELPEELTEEKLQPVLEKLSNAVEELDSPSGWGGWGNWGVSSFINTATAGVSTLTSHVSHGFTLLEETMGVEPIETTELDKPVEQEIPVTDDKKPDEPEESQMQLSFGFGNFISGVSSITKLVESTSTRVMTGGLDTLEAIGKKTMEVLQEGDPGLKKKRAFFLNDSDKPNLSHILREAKEKADTAEKTFEEKQLARKVHFESLFDDYQGLVHLEALEMLSKQSNIKIQQHLVGLDTDELTSIQETLEEVKELCDLGDDDENEDNEDVKDLKLRLEEACKDLGVTISYEKLFVAWEESQSYLKPPVTHASQDMFQCAISTLAKFTAFSVERFHKTAELLLIKERRSTVNEADALVQLTRILSNQIGLLAYRYCNSLKELNENSKTSDNVNTNITTIFMEASNASSYIQDAFRLLIPILQVGAI